MSSLALLVVARALLAAARARGAPKGIGLVVLRRRGRRRPRRAARLRGAFQSSAVAAAVSFISGGGARPGAAPGRVREVPSLKWTPRARDKYSFSSLSPSRVAATACYISRCICLMPPAMLSHALCTLSSLPGPRAPILERTARLGLAHVEQVPDGLPHHVRVHVAHGAGACVIPGKLQERPR